MNLKEIKELIKIIDSSNLSEFHIEVEDIKLTIKKEVVVSRANSYDGNEYVVREAEAKSEFKDIDVIPEIKVEENLHVIKSPIVGFFYSSASPESEAFAKVGGMVKAGDVLCIVEAMKLMNEITSDVDGEIIEVLVQNQNPVEFGQPLFKIRRGLV